MFSLMREKFKNIFNVNYSVNRFQSHWFNSNIATITPLLIIIIIIIIIVIIPGLSYLVFTLTNSATCSGTPTTSTTSRTLFDSFSIVTMNQLNSKNPIGPQPTVSNLLPLLKSEHHSANTSNQQLLLLPTNGLIVASSYYSLPSWSNNGRNSGKLKLRTRRSRANIDEGHSIILSSSTSTNSDITTNVALSPSEATLPKQTYNNINEQYSYFNEARQYHSEIVSTSSSSSLSTEFVSDDRNNIVIDDNNSAFNLPKPEPLQQLIPETDEQSEQEKQIIRTARHRHKNSEKDFGNFCLFVCYA